MDKKLESTNEHANEGLLADRMLQVGGENSRQGNSTNRSRKNCHNIKPGYHGAAKVDSDSSNLTGEVKMNNVADVKLESMQVKIDSNEKVINAGLAGNKAELEGHKAELAGHKANMDGKFEAILGELRSGFQAINSINSEFKAINSEFKAIRSEMKENTASLKIWVIVTIISTIVASAGFIAALFAIFSTFSGGK